MSGGVVSKAEFAALCKVEPSRLSHWIREGKISGKAIVGEGRGARIDVAEAQRQLRIKLDSGQRLGNGLGTKLSGRSAAKPETEVVAGVADTPAGTDAVAPDDVVDDALDAEIKREKLVALQRANRKGAEEEAASQGRYTETAAARRQMILVGAQVLRTFEGAIPEIATGLAGRFKIEQREVTLALNELFRTVREDAAKKAKAAAEKLDALMPGAAEA